MEKPVCIIGNPAAGGGRAARVLADVRRATASWRRVEISVTDAPGDETRLAERAVADGVGAIIAVGGDGTWSKVAAALLRSDRPPPLALIAAGTGNDFAKSVKAPARDIRRTLALIESGQTRRVDVGAVEGRFFLVCCGFGFDTAVLHRMQRIRGLRGRARYTYAALRELPRYGGIAVSIAKTGGAPQAERMTRLLMLVVANAEHYGGAFKIAPGASLADGMLDVVSVSPLSTMRRAALLFAARSGAHTGSPAVTVQQRPWLGLEFPEPPEYNIDGDLFRARSRSIRIACLPAALEVVAAVG